jgi:hypothetical protein
MLARVPGVSLEYQERISLTRLLMTGDLLENGLGWEARELATR